MSAVTGIGRASLFLASGTVVSRILGFIKVIVLARAIGLHSVGDAFAVANQLPNQVYVIVAGGVLTAVLVPQIVRSSLHEDGGKAYINKLITLALVILAVTTIVATLLAPVLTQFVGARFSEPIVTLAIGFAYWCIPQIFFYGLYTVLGEVLNARKSFGPFTWVPVLNNVVAIGGLVLFMAMFGSGERPVTAFTAPMIAVLGGSATLGVLAQAVVLFYFWKRIGLRYRPDFAWRGVGLGAAGKMASWTFGMLILTTIAGVIETQVATEASGGDDASVAVLTTAWLIFMLPHSVITVSVATAYFTRMSEHASLGKLALVREDASSAIRGTSLLIVLAAAVIAVCAYPFAAVFATEGFTQVQDVGNVIIAYVLGLVAFCILFVIQRTFYALGDTRTPFFFTLFQSVLVVAGVLACGLLPTEWIAAGIALVVTLAGIAQTVFASLLLRNRLGRIDGKRILQSLITYAVASVIPVGLGILLLNALGGTRQGGFAVSSIAGAIVSMIVIGIVMSAAYLGMLILMRSQELAALTDPLLSRLRR